MFYADGKDVMKKILPEILSCLLNYVLKSVRGIGLIMVERFNYGRDRR